MKTYTRATIQNVRLVGGGTTDIPRCQHETIVGQCLRAAGHGDDNGGRPSYQRADGGHIIRWGTDPQ